MEKDGVIIASVVYEDVAGWVGTFNAHLRDTCPAVYERWVELMGDTVKEMIERCGCDVLSVREVEPR